MANPARRDWSGPEPRKPMTVWTSASWGRPEMSGVGSDRRFWPKSDMATAFSRP